MSSTEARSELRIKDLDMTSDPGTYTCNGTNSEGTGQATITLRVRSHLAALWPFLGIVAEVLVLVTIIFIYEKRRKPDEPLDGEQWGGAAFLSLGRVGLLPTALLPSLLPLGGKLLSPAVKGAFHSWGIGCMGRGLAPQLLGCTCAAGCGLCTATP